MESTGWLTRPPAPFIRRMIVPADYYAWEREQEREREPLREPRRCRPSTHATVDIGLRPYVERPAVIL